MNSVCSISSEFADFHCGTFTWELLSPEGFPMLSLIYIEIRVTHTYTTIHILPMSSAFLSRPLVGLASCLKAGNCFYSYFFFLLLMLIRIKNTYNNTTLTLIPQCLYVNLSQIVFLYTKHHTVNKPKHLVSHFTFPLSPSLTLKPRWHAVGKLLLH